MTSTAISAQGTTFEIGTGSGSPVSIASGGVAVGVETILTATAHGFNVGDVVTFNSGFAGADAALLNGITVSVKAKTTNTFAIGVDTTGKTITYGTATATAATFTAVADIKDYSGFDGSASELDKTNLASTAKEFSLGLVDNGQFSMNLDYAAADAGQTALRAKRVSGVLSNFRLTLPDTTVITFSGYVKKFTQGGGVDALVKSSCDIRISGAVTGL